MIRTLKGFLFWAGLLAVGAGVRAQSLPTFDIEEGAVTVSGVSSGAFMAHQIHIAHSALISGAAMVAGGPFACAVGSIWPTLITATAICMDLKDDFMPFLGPPLLESSLKATRRAQAAGDIDDTSHLANDQVYLFSGARDTTVPESVMDVVRDFYAGFLEGEAIEYVTDVEAGHGFVTPNGTVACGETEFPYLNLCGYDTAGALLNRLYGGGLARPEGQGELQPLRTFDQRPFVPSAFTATSAGLGDEGYLYVPRSCEDGGPCRLHVALHGCRQSSSHVGDDFATLSGYNSWADVNRIIVVYPQARPTRSWWPGRANPRGCWDWWGYSTSHYYARTAPQIAAVFAMIRQMMAGP